MATSLLVLLDDIASVLDDVGVMTKTGSGRSVFFWYAANCPRLALLQIANSRS